MRSNKYDGMEGIDVQAKLRNLKRIDPGYHATVTCRSSSARNPPKFLLGGDHSISFDDVFIKE